MAPEEPYNRFRWRQTSEDPDAAPQRVELTVPQLEAAQFYCNACEQIDLYNRCRKDDLKLENYIGTMDRSMRVKMAVLGSGIVDTWLIYKGYLG
jgi:hypothetical protein